MSRVYIMTFGLCLIFLGIQVFMVKAYVLTPEASRFVSERFEDPDAVSANSNGINNFSPYSQAGYQNGFNQQIRNAAYSMSTPAQRSLAPPSWLCWPIFFMGAVVFLHGIALRKNN